MSTRILPLKIVFLIRSLDCGGAERQLVTLAQALHNRGIPISVVIFYRGGVFEANLQAAGVPVRCLDKSGRWDLLGFGFRLRRTLAKERADVIHSYLGAENIALALLKPLLRPARIVWGVRASNMDMSQYDWFSRLAYRVEAGLSRVADLIIANSNAGRDQALKRGFPSTKTVVIPNGVDTGRFRPDQIGRDRVRTEWAIQPDQLLVGCVGRLDPMKDHPTFLKSAQLLNQRLPATRFVCVGEGPVAYARSLRVTAETLGIASRFIWAGARPDMPAVYSALDVLCIASGFGEGFPNVVGEAMACGTPCVVTDVGDAAAVVGELGVVVKPGDFKALAAGCETLLLRNEERRASDSQAVRARVGQEFSVAKLADRTLAALEGLALNRDEALCQPD